MKTLVFLLVLGNLLFYAYSAGHFGQPDNPDAARLEQQVTPERMHLISHGEAPPPAKPPETPPPASAPEPVVENICLRWNNLAASDADRIGTLIGEKFSEFATKKQAAPSESSSWWVFIPPFANKADAEKKAGELRDLGVSDYFIVQEAGSNHLAISLGIFSSEKGAQERLADLKAKTVRSARAAPRPGKEKLFNLEVRGPLSRKNDLLQASALQIPVRDCK